MDLTIKIDRIPAEGRELQGHLAAPQLRECLNISEEAGFDTPDGARIALRIDKIEHAIRITGKVTTTVNGECARCLAEARHPVDCNVDMTLFPDKPGETGDQADAQPESSTPELDNPGVQSGVYSGLTFDLTDNLRELILLELPMRLLCDEGCAGLCDLCGKNLNEGPCGCVHDEVDPRWEKLKEIKVS